MVHPEEKNVWAHFVNDSLRSDFHRRFMDKYIKLKDFLLVIVHVNRQWILYFRYKIMSENIQETVEN